MTPKGLFTIFLQIYLKKEFKFSVCPSKEDPVFLFSYSNSIENNKSKILTVTPLNLACNYSYILFILLEMSVSENVYNRSEIEMLLH